MYWYRFEVTGGQIREGGLLRMERQFEECTRPRAQKSACLLREWQPYDEGAVFYLYAATPVSDDVLSGLFSAKPCEAPSVRETRFWAGDIGLNEHLRRADSE